MRLLAQSPAPAAWLPGWPPKREARRCRCGAWVVARSVRFQRCVRGCVRLPPTPPPPPRPAPAPAGPSARERANYAKMIPVLRVLEAKLVREQRKGRPPARTRVEDALLAMRMLEELCPAHGSEILAALPWLSRQAGGGRAA